MSDLELPKFNRPPVVETALGIQFEPIPGICNGHLGAYWKTIQAEWPKASDAVALDPEIEQFGTLKPWGQVRLKLTHELSTRLQMRNRDEDRMVQVQNGRFHYNWLGHKGGPYPEYERVRPAFDKELKTFEEFIRSTLETSVIPTQWEVTYVNHIAKDTVWSNSRDWASLFRCPVSLEADESRVKLESFSSEWHYEIPPKLGRLHVNLRHAIREKAGEELLVLTLTARGSLRGKDRTITIAEGLDLGHTAIVSTFRDITSDSAHQYWDPKNAS